MANEDAETPQQRYQTLRDSGLSPNEAIRKLEAEMDTQRAELEREMLSVSRVRKEGGVQELEEQARKTGDMIRELTEAADAIVRLRNNADSLRVGPLDQMIAGATDTAKVASAFYIACVRQGVPAEVAASLAEAYLSVMLHNAAMHEGE